MTARLYDEDAYLRECDATVVAIDEGGGLILDRTICYPTGGGQPGDAGHLVLPDGQRLTLATTVKGTSPGTIAHVLGEGSEAPAVGTAVRVELDWEQRHRHMRMHTALHLLSTVLPFPVTGGKVGSEKSRLDFHLPEPPPKEEITEALNALIAKDHAVSSQWITEEELARSPELVKTMSVAPPTGAGRIRLVRIEDCDLQACGGTHVARIAEIGEVVVRKVENKGRQNRRVIVSLVG
ncbi:MAG: alanyl-tRNA editing protein [Myxococcales bacterium]|nr:alanyl-tRNA editing protein [Myxococcales bacterium]